MAKGFAFLYKPTVFHDVVSVFLFCVRVCVCASVVLVFRLSRIMERFCFIRAFARLHREKLGKNLKHSQEDKKK